MVDGLSAGLSAMVNNLPTALLGVFALGSGHTAPPAATYALILVVDIGPKITPFDSLATLLWLHILAQQGMPSSWGRYVRENWWVTLLVLAASLGALAVV